MASYKLLYKEVNPADPLSVITKIEYTFDNGAKKTVDVNHHNPKTIQELDANIKTRGQSEWKRIADAVTTEQSLTALDPFINQPISFDQVVPTP